MRRHQQREEVCDQVDLRKQAKRHAGHQRDELEIASQLFARKRTRRAAADGMKTAAAPRLSPSGVKPICWGVLDQGFPDVRRRAELTALFCLDVGRGSPCDSRRERGRHEGAGFPVLVEQLDDLTEVQRAALTAALAGKGSTNEAIARWSTSRPSIQSPR